MATDPSDAPRPRRARVRRAVATAWFWVVFGLVVVGWLNRPHWFWLSVGAIVIFLRGCQFGLRRSRNVFRISKAGWAFIGFSLVIGAAAINTGVNLLYLVLAMMLSAITMSGVLNRTTFRLLDVERRLPDRVRAGESTAVRVRLTNRKRRLPSLSLSAVEALVPAGPDGEADDGAESVTGETHVWQVDAGESVEVTVHLTVPRRGEWISHGGRLTSAFPFGFFRKSRPLPEGGRVLVGPPIPVRGARAIPGFAREEAVETRRTAPTRQEEDFHGLRDYREGDNPRWIHWRTTARTGDLRVKEFERTRGRTAVVALDLPDRPPADEEAAADVEAAVAVAADMARRALADGRRVLVLAGGDRPLVLGPLEGTGAGLAVDEALAVVRPGPVPAARAAEDVRAELLRGAACVLVRPAGMTAPPPGPLAALAAELREVVADRSVLPPEAGGPAPPGASPTAEGAP